MKYDVPTIVTSGFISKQLSWMMVGMAVNVCFTPFGQPIVDERLLLIPYFITAVSTTGLRLVMVNECLV